MTVNVLKAIKIVNEETISSLASKISVSQVYMTNVLQGKKKLTEERINIISSVYNLPLFKIEELDALDNEEIDPLKNLQFLMYILVQYYCDMGKIKKIIPIKRMYIQEKF